MGATFELLKERCRAAGVGEYEWSRLLQDIGEWVGGSKSMLLGVSPLGPYRHSLDWNHNPEAAERYNSRYNLLDPRAPFSKVTPLHVSQLGQQYVRNQDIEKTEYFDAISLFADVKDSVHGIIADNAETGRQTISVQRGFAEDFFSATEAGRLQALLPVLEEAIRDSLRIARILGSQASHNGYAYLLVDPGLNIQFFDCTDDLPIFVDGGSLGIAAGKLITPSAQVDLACSSAVRKAVSGTRLDLRLAGYELQFSPVPEVLRWCASHDSAFLTIARRQGHISTRAGLYALAHGFSDSESELLAQLVENPDLREASRVLGKSYETVRWHVKNMLDKSATTRRDAMLDAARRGKLD